MDSDKEGMTPICEIGVLSSSSSTLNLNSVSVAPHFNQSHFESTIFSFLSFPDTPSFSNSLSFDRLLHDFLYPTADDDSVQDQLIDRTLRRVSLLLESTKQCYRKRLTLHNSISWLLPADLTIKVFSLLDTKSLMQVMACCTMFNKYATDPLCYSHIDTTTDSAHVDDGVVCTLIHRAGKELRSLKVGNVAEQHYFRSLTSSCLAPLLSSDCVFTGNLLRSLHMFHLDSMDINSLCAVLSTCSNLTDLKIVGFPDSLDLVLDLIMRKCHLVEHLWLEKCYSFKRELTDSTIEAFVINGPNLTSLTLKDFMLNDAMVRVLVNGFPKLKYLNLSSKYEIDGSFLRDLGRSCLIETLILRDCFSLKEREVLEFLNSLIAGEFKFIRYIDVSRDGGLVCDEDERTTEPNFPLEKLKEERSDLTFVAVLTRAAKRYRIWEDASTVEWTGECDSDYDWSC